MSEQLYRGTSLVLAHQGGWDEILWVAAPLAIVAGLLFIANRRANRLGESDHREAERSAQDLSE